MDPGDEASNRVSNIRRSRAERARLEIERRHRSSSRGSERSSRSSSSRNNATNINPSRNVVSNESGSARNPNRGSYYRNVRNALEKRKQNEKLRENVLKLIKLQKPHLERIQNVNNQIKLELLSENTKHEKFASIQIQVSSRLHSGEELSTCLRKYPKVFAPITVGLIEAGEAGGILDKVLDRIATLIEQQAKIKSQIKYVH